ncbi:MAG TPA: anti-sigma factor, partial [Aggregatilineales bacterium]|nr:anti-sigma factor [Aggregatilineales bacterium]
MTAHLDKETIRELLPAYALGAVEDSLSPQIEAAIKADPELQAEYAVYESIVDSLTAALPSVEPSPDLGARILTQASMPAAKSDTSQSSADAEVIPFSPPPLWRRYGLMAAGVLVIVLAVALWLAFNTSEDDPIAAILNDDNSITIDLAGAEGFESLHGRFVVAHSGERAVLQLNNLDVLSQEEAYQLWLIRGEEDRDSPLT